MNLKLIEDKDVKHLMKVLEEVNDKLTELVSGGQVSKKIGKWLPEKEARIQLGKGQTTVWKMRMQGILEWTKIGNRVYISQDSILAVLDSNKKEAYNQN